MTSKNRAIIFLSGALAVCQGISNAEIRPADPDILAKWNFGESVAQDADGQKPNYATEEDVQKHGIRLDNDHPTLPWRSESETRLGRQFSVSAWVKPNTSLSEPLGAVAPALADDVPLQFGLSGNRLRLTFRDSGGKPIVMETAGEMEPGRWNLVTLVANDDQFRVYVDDEVQLVGRIPSIKSTEEIKSANTDTAAIRLGDVIPQVQGDDTFTGMVDEITVFSRALTQEEVKEKSADLAVTFIPGHDSMASEDKGVDLVVVIGVFVLIFFIAFGVMMGRRN